MEVVQPTKPFRDIEDLVIGDENNVSEGEISFCSLGGINYSKLVDVSDEELYEIIKIGLKTILQMMRKAPPLTATTRSKMLARANAGLGISGLADWLYQKGLDFDGSKESLEAVAWLAERHAYLSYKASVELVSEGYAPAVEGVHHNWLPIDTMKNITGRKLSYNWEEIRGKPRAFSVHNCVQPFESSSVFFDGSNSVYPVREKMIGKVSRSGAVMQHFPHFDEDKHLSAWDIPQITLSKYYSVIQDYTDLAISADQYFNPENYPSGRKPLSVAMAEWVAHFELGNKTLYYLNTKVSQEDSQVYFKANNQETLGAVDFEDCEDCKM